MIKNGPTAGYICNSQGESCEYLDTWYNGGSSVFGRCKKNVWKNIKQWPRGTGCETPKSCPFIKLK